MKPLMTLKKTKAKGNPYGYKQIAILALNYDGKGGALVRWDRNPDLESLSVEDLDVVLLGDSGTGTRYYRVGRP